MAQNRIYYCRYSYHKRFARAMDLLEINDADNFGRGGNTLEIGNGARYKRSRMFSYYQRMQLRRLCDYRENSNNDITMITANSSLVNSLARNTALLSQSKINDLTSFDVNVPFGTLSGIPLLSEKGPKINIVVTPVGTVNCTFTSTFETAGINQTLHRIYLNVESVVDLIIPTAHTEVATSTPVLLCESVIIGKSPRYIFAGRTASRFFLTVCDCVLKILL